MTGTGLRIGLCLAALAVPAIAGEAPRDEPARASRTAVAPQPAQRSLLEEIIEEERVDTEIPAPFGAYVGVVARRVARRFAAPVVGAIEGLGGVAWVVVRILVVVVPGLAIFLLVRALLRRRRRGRSRGVDDDPHVLREPPAEDPAEALAAALAGGRATEALRLLWALLARTLAERGLASCDPSLTNRELVDLARRRWPRWSALDTLEELARESDRLMYAGEAPRLDEVRRLVARARELPA